jgi:Ca2+/H+ antiporter
MLYFNENDYLLLFYILTLCFPIGFHFLAYPNLFGIKGFVVVVVVVLYLIFLFTTCRMLVTIIGFKRMIEKRYWLWQMR